MSGHSNKMGLSCSICHLVFLACIVGASGSQPLQQVSIPVSSNGFTGVVEARNNVSMLRREGSLASQFSYKAYDGKNDYMTMQEHLTCWFTIDYQVDTVYYNGKSVNVSGMEGSNAHLWAREKSFEIPKVQLVKNAYLTITGQTKLATDKGCSAGMFQLYCNNGVDSSDATMQAYGSAQAPDDEHLKGGGEHWGQPCVTTNTGAFIPSHPEAAKIFGTDAQFATFRVMPYRDEDITGTPAPRARFLEEYWANWTGNIREGQKILEQKCAPGNYIVSWVMLCSAPGMPHSITGGPSVGVDRIIRAECSDGAMLTVEQGGENGAAHTMVWPNGRQKVQMRFGRTTSQVMTGFDTCGGTGQEDSTSYIQQCPQDLCPNCTISGFGIRYEYNIEGFRIFCQKTLPMEKTAEVVTRTIETVQHAIDSANSQILASAQDVNRATDQLTVASKKEKEAETASDHAYSTALMASGLARTANEDSEHSRDGAARAEAWSQTANADAKAADILAHNAKQKEEFVASDIINKEHQISQTLERIGTGVEANTEVSDRNFKASQEAKKLVGSAEVLVDAAAKDSALVSQREKDMAAEIEGFEHASSKVGDNAKTAEEDAQKAKLAGMQSVQETEGDLSAAEKQSAMDNANLAKLIKEMQAIQSKEGASNEDVSLMRSILNEASNDTIHSSLAAREAERLYGSTSKLSDQAARDAAAAHRAFLGAENAAGETTIGLQNVRGFAYRGQMADEESSREQQMTEDEARDTMQTASMARVTLHQVAQYAMKTNQSLAQAKRDLGYVQSTRDAIEGELQNDIISLGRELTEKHVKKITFAVTSAHQAHHEADVANGVAQTALNQAAVAMSSAHSRVSESHYAREIAGKELAEAQQDMDDIAVEAAKTKQMHDDAEKALQSTKADDAAAQAAVHDAKTFAQAADREIGKGREMLADIDHAKAQAEQARNKADVALHAVEDSLSQIKADSAAAHSAKSQAQGALQTAQALKAETQQAREEADHAVAAAKAAAQESQSAITNAKADAEAQKEDLDAAGSAASEASTALADTEEAGKLSLEAQEAASSAIGDVKGAHDDATTALTASENALADANQSTAEAVSAISQAKAGSQAAKQALDSVATEANAIGNLKSQMSNWQTNTVKIEHLLLFLANQSDMNQKTADALNHTTDGLVGAVDGLNKTRKTQQKILEGLAKHTEADEKIMAVLAKHENVSEALMNSIKRNAETANKSLLSVEKQGNAIDKVLKSLESAEKTKNATIVASKAMQTSLNKQVTGIEKVNGMLNGTLQTIGANGNALRETLNVVGANQKTLKSVVGGIRANVAAQNASLAASAANTAVLGKALNQIQQGHNQDKKMIAALRKMETADEAQMSAADAHSEVDASTLNTLEQAQKTDDKLVSSVAKTQNSQKAMLSSIKSQEQAVTATLAAVEKSQKSIGNTLVSVQQTQMAQGAQLNALGANSKLIRASVGTVQHNQLTDERVLNDVSGLDRQEHSDAQRLNSAVHGFQARIQGAESQERKNGILLNREDSDDSRLRTEVNGLRQVETLMQGDEIKHRQELATAAQRQQDVMDVQKLHRQAMMKLAKVQFQSVKYLEGVAGKVVQGENDLKTLNQRMHGVETGIVGLEAQQKAGDNTLARLDASESHMGQNIFSVEQRSIHDHSALRLEEEAQGHVKKVASSVYYAEKHNYHSVDQMEHQIAGGYGSASFQRSLPQFQARLRSLKGDVQVLQSDAMADRTHINAIEHQEKQDAAQIRGDLSHDQAELMRTAHRGQDLDRSIKDEERIERGYSQNAAEEEHEMAADQRRLEEEGRKAAAMRKEADGMDVERVKNDVTGVSQKAATATEMAKNYYKGVESAKQQEARIRAAESQTAADYKDIRTDNHTFSEQIAGLEKEETHFMETQKALEQKMHESENKISVKIEGMQKLASNPDQQVSSLSNQQQTHQEEVAALDNGIQTEDKVIDKIEEKNNASKTLDKTLEEHEKRLNENVDAINEMEKQAATNIHILAGILLVFVLGSAVLHNMWHGRIEVLKKELAEEPVG
eukprot:gnl/MRDRNA2_/MRDRNA2_89213_c0_seq1.p1 gnl/MRDRNA2_/MRDRNA2_89213_c0~~gnl/MRDRNA2_/MRDRNA2_89213_c0_seq1.p1  ORF type:complete len:2044 (+),score=572.84 gnl/MRDRNA2_/MRDRNA2_89213_c0_seq1:99-6230(+)